MSVDSDQPESLHNYLSRLSLCIDSLRDFGLYHEATKQTSTTSFPNTDNNNPSTFNTALHRTHSDETIIARPPAAPHPAAGEQSVYKDQPVDPRSSRQDSVMAGTPPKPAIGGSLSSSRYAVLHERPPLNMRLPTSPPSRNTSDPNVAPRGGAMYTAQDARSGMATFAPRVPSQPAMPSRNTVQTKLDTWAAPAPLSLPVRPQQPPTLNKSQPNNAPTVDKGHKPIVRGATDENAAPIKAMTFPLFGTRGSTVKIKGPSVPAANKPAEPAKSVRKIVFETIKEEEETPQLKDIPELAKAVKEHDQAPQPIGEKNTVEPIKKEAKRTQRGTSPALFDLEARFAELSSELGSEPKSEATETSWSKPDDNDKKLESTPVAEPEATEVTPTLTENIEDEVKQPGAAAVDQAVTAQSLGVGEAPDQEPLRALHEDPNQAFFTKAAEYMDALTRNMKKSLPVDIIAEVAVHVKSAYASSDAPTKESQALKLNVVNAATAYLNTVAVNTEKRVNPVDIYEVLNESHGNYLYLCGRLVTVDRLKVDTGELIAFSCAVKEAIPSSAEQQDAKAPSMPARASATGSAPAPATQSAQTPTPASGGTQKIPGLTFSAWPEREKREKTAQHRTVSLTNVSSIASLNELQALVWGGRVERFIFEKGKNIAYVKFLTPEGCKKFFDASGNGLEIPSKDGKKGPMVDVAYYGGINSTNDLVQNVTLAEHTRCVRSIGADEDWPRGMLTKLAVGKDRREVDKIIEGKTENGRHFVEFRFGNIYHAMQFRQQLFKEEDWEHTNAIFAPDPCDVHEGIHMQD